MCSFMISTYLHVNMCVCGHCVYVTIEASLGEKEGYSHVYFCNILENFNSKYLVAKATKIYL